MNLATADENNFNQWDIYFNPLCILDQGRGSIYAGVDYFLTPIISIGPYIGEGSSGYEGVRFRGGGVRVDFLRDADSHVATSQWRPYLSPFYSRYEFHGTNSPNYKVVFDEDRNQVKFTNVGVTAGYFFNEVDSTDQQTFFRSTIVRVGIGIMHVQQSGKIVMIDDDEESLVFTPNRDVQFTFDLNIGPSW